MGLNDTEISTGIYGCTSGLGSVVHECTTGGCRVPTYTPLSKCGCGLAGMPNASIYWKWLGGVTEWGHATSEFSSIVPSS